MNIRCHAKSENKKAVEAHTHKRRKKACEEKCAEHNKKGMFVLYVAVPSLTQVLKSRRSIYVRLSGLTI